MRILCNTVDRPYYVADPNRSTLGSLMDKPTTTIQIKVTAAERAALESLPKKSNYESLSGKLRRILLELADHAPDHVSRRF